MRRSRRSKIDVTSLALLCGWTVNNGFRRFSTRYYRENCLSPSLNGNCWQYCVEVPGWFVQSAFWFVTRTWCFTKKDGCGCGFNKTDQVVSLVGDFAHFERCGRIFLLRTTSYRSASNTFQHRWLFIGWLAPWSWAALFTFQHWPTLTPLTICWLIHTTLQHHYYPLIHLVDHYEPFWINIDLDSPLLIILFLFQPLSTIISHKTPVCIHHDQSFSTYEIILQLVLTSSKYQSPVSNQNYYQLLSSHWHLFNQIRYRLLKPKLTITCQ